MTIPTSSWTTVTPSQYAWEQDGLDYLRTGMDPIGGTWHVWTNFEFQARSGAIYEVDALVLSPMGLWLVEIKSIPGHLRQEDGLWVFDEKGRRPKTIENPVFLANRKAKALKGLLQDQLGGGRGRIPWITPVIFCNGKQLHFELTGADAMHVALIDSHNAVKRGQANSIIKVLSTGQLAGGNDRTPRQVDRRDVPPTIRAVNAVTRSKTARATVGDYHLIELLDEGVGYQDWLGVHQTLTETKRRIRWYLVHDQATKDERNRIQRAAEREARVLQGVREPGILAFREFISTDRGPALTFDFVEHATRLDHWLAQQEQGLDPLTAYELLGKLAHAVKHAHSHHLVHRALSPESVLCLLDPGNESAIPEIALINWQTALVQQGTLHTSGTIHLEDLLDSRAAVYCAPEALRDPDKADDRADIFSLGCIAWRLFTGKAPAANQLELNRILQDQGGLQLAAAQDGVPPELDYLIEAATQASVNGRIHIDDFLCELEGDEHRGGVLKALVIDTPEDLAADPTQAHKGEKLQDDRTGAFYTIEAKVGTGASAVAYRVTTHGGDTRVLKVARSGEHGAILKAEYETLTGLRDARIVQVHELLQVQGHTAILMQDAGESLAARLRSDGRLHYDMLQRLGSDLLHAVDFLEREGVYHRDLKPDNMGISTTRGDRKKVLVLFDFSLSTTPVSKITVGTRQYLDPFLSLRPTPRYDTHAERYAAAMTLYEMATATHPKWGDGVSDPAADQSAELQLHLDLFPPVISEALAKFFKRAFDRKPERRFDNAHDMLAAWITLFRKANESSGTTHHSDLDPKRVTLETRIDRLGLSAPAHAVLDRLGILTLRDLLALRLGDLRGRKGITNATKIQIRDAKLDWTKQFPGIEERDLTVIGPTAGTMLTGDDDGPLERRPLDDVFEKVFEDITEGTKRHENITGFLGLGDVPCEERKPWPNQMEVAAHVDRPQGSISQDLSAVRNTWKRSQTIQALRESVRAILDTPPDEAPDHTTHVGIMPADELADALLAQRGSRISDPKRRRAIALAVLRAAVEAEADSAKPAFQVVRGDHTVFVARGTADSRYADALGAIADELVATLPPASPNRAIERLRTVNPPEDLALDNRRLLQLASRSSATACLSADRQELYPRGMPALEALKLASGAFAALQRCSADDIINRVESRYPEAELLPEPPRLAQLVMEAGLQLDWRPDETLDEERPDRRGVFVRPHTVPSITGSLSSLLSSSRSHAGRSRLDEKEAEVAECDRRLRRSHSGGGFCALQVDHRLGLATEQALRAAFPDLGPIDLDARLIQAMQRFAAEQLKADWSVVLKADTARAGTADADNLHRLAATVADQLVDELLARPGPLLLTNPGLFARYGLATRFDTLRDRAGTPQGPSLIWLLIATTTPGGHPSIDGTAVPILGSNQTLTLLPRWVQRHIDSEAAA